jgi:hypothetical protein
VLVDEHFSMILKGAFVTLLTDGVSTMSILPGITLLTDLHTTMLKG